MITVFWISYNARFPNNIIFFLYYLAKSHPFIFCKLLLLGSFVEAMAAGAYGVLSTIASDGRGVEQVQNGAFGNLSDGQLASSMGCGMGGDMNSAIERKFIMQTLCLVDHLVVFLLLYMVTKAVVIGRLVKTCGCHDSHWVQIAVKPVGALGG
jgi:hypothetical protein